MPAKQAPRAAGAETAILIVDDHPMLRRGLAALIGGEPGLSVCGEASSCASALEAIGKSHPDLAIIDLGLEGGDGLDLIKELKARYPEILTLVLSMHDESVYAERAFKAGARGYVTKQELDETVLIAIRRVLAGTRYMSPRLEERFAAKYLGDRIVEKDSPLAILTDRELEVYRLIGHGETTRAIAERLGLSVKTIESHREHLKHKLTLESAAALVQSATRWVDSGGVS